MKQLMIYSLLALVLLISFSFYLSDSPAPSYVGTQACVCHVTNLTNWRTTSHSKIQQVPGPNTVVGTPWQGTTINLGSGYGNATLTLSLVSGIYKVTLNPSSGSPVTYDVAYTMGWDWRQYYLVKIVSSYYRLPLEWEYEGYKEPQGGHFTATSQSSYFNTDGTLKLTNNNTFRRGAWDRSCGNCHVTGNRLSVNISGTDTTFTLNWANNSDTGNAKVGCEECHGPGGDHVVSPNKNNIFGPLRMGQAGVARMQDLCGKCHNRVSSTNLTYGFPWKESVDSGYSVGTPLSNYIDANWRNRINLTGGPTTWPDTMTKRAYRQQWVDFQLTNNRMSQMISCKDCHDPHSYYFEHQLKRDPDNNDICISCHNNFGGVGNPNIQAITAHTKHIYDPTNQNQTGGASRCIKCHMTAVAYWDHPYELHNHTFRVVRPIKTLEKRSISTPTLGMLNSCAVSCHRNPSSASGTGNVPNLGVGTDSLILDWRELTDSTLADTLNRWFNRQIWPIGIKQISSEVPDKYSLDQNYPNPFNPFTVISFSIPKTEFVSLKIYDITGREVYTLIGEKLSAGKYIVNWNGINIIGDDVASGVYMYRITAGDFINARKMILIK